MLLFGLVGCRTHDVPLNMLDRNSVEPIKIVEVKIKKIYAPNEGKSTLEAVYNGQDILIYGLATNDKKFKPGEPVEIKKGQRYIVALYGPIKHKIRFITSKYISKEARRKDLMDYYQCLNLYGDRFYPVSEDLLYLDGLDLYLLE